MADGQVDPRLVAQRDRQFGCSAEEIRRTRGREIGYAPPNVAFPASLDNVGRQWTNEGEDKPTKRS
jgi:hypothetical protein